MNPYRKTLVVDAAPADVYAALTTPDGLRGWWTEDCDIATEVGGTHHFRFARTRKAMRVERLDAEREVRWLCTDAHIAADRLAQKDEWVGTELVFRLTPAGGARTQLHFEHIGLVPSLECYALCDDGWTYFMASLRQFVETGFGTPFAPAVGATCSHAARQATGSQP